MSYKKLEIWMLARELSIKIHKMSLSELPGFEMDETGSQIRRSSKSTRSLIVEGYGRRQYKQDFIRFLVNAMASNDETNDHLDTLWETKSLTNRELYNELSELVNRLGMKINRFVYRVKENHNELREPDSEYYLCQNETGTQNPVSEIKHRESRN